MLSFVLPLITQALGIAAATVFLLDWARQSGWF